jgi:hypothetical protein
MTEEFWKPILIGGRKTNYEVSSLGRIRCNGSFFEIQRTRRNFIKKTPADSNGHLTVQLSADGVPNNLRVARLVGQAFCREFRPWLRPLYLDGNKANCAASNLQWVPQSAVTGIPFSKTLKK